jgi:hypothetical protein
LRTAAVRTFVAWATAVFVFLLFAFPNYCDKCTYRDVARRIAEAKPSLLPPCCAAKAAKEGEGKKPAKRGDGTHVRYTFCIAKTLSSIADHRDVLREIRLAVTCAPYRSVERRFAGLSPPLVHKDPRAPPG